MRSTQLNEPISPKQLKSMKVVTSTDNQLTLNEEPILKTSPSKSRQLLLFLTYGLTILSVSAPPALYPSMQRDIPNFTSGDAATVLAIATVGTGLGKINAMLTVSKFGARKTYFAAQCLLSIFVFLLSLSNAVWLVALLSFSMELSAGPSWPSHAVIVRGWWSTELLPSAFWILSLSSRGSDMSSKLLYGSLLNAGVPWRWLLRIASCGAVFGAILSRWHRDSMTESDVTCPTANPKKQLHVFITISKSKKFWVAGIAMLLLTCVKKSGQLTSLYFRDCTNTTLLSDGGAAQMGVVFQMGLMTSVLIFGKIYEKLKQDNSRIVLCVSLVFMSTLSGILLATDGGKTSDSKSLLIWRAILVFLVAVGVGLTYYVPMGVFSVKFGQENTALVSAYLDLLGYLTSAIFLSGILRPAINVGWSSAWWCLTFVSVVACFATVIFLRMLLYDTISVILPCKQCQCLGDGVTYEKNGNGKEQRYDMI